MFTNPANYELIAAIQVVMAKAGIEETVPQEIIDELKKLDEHSARQYKALHLHSFVSRTLTKWIGNTGSQSVWPQLDLGGTIGKPLLYGKRLTPDDLKVIRNAWMTTAMKPEALKIIKRIPADKRSWALEVFNTHGWDHFRWLFWNY